MAYYKYLGYGITNDNGTAHLEYDENGRPLNNSYIGKGAGEIDIVSSPDTTITNESIISPTVSFMDTLFYDEATSDVKANQYSDVTTNRSWSTNGTTLSYTADSGTKYCNTVIGGTRNWFDSTKKYQVELDFSFERADTNSACGLGFGSNGYNLHNLFSGALTGSGHLKITTDENTYQLYLDGTPKGEPITITGISGLYFTIYRTGELTFKDLKIWRI